MGVKKFCRKKKNCYKTVVFVFDLLVHILLMILFTICIICAKNNSQLPNAVFVIAGVLMFLFITETKLLIINSYRLEYYAKNLRAECIEKLIDSLIKKNEEGLDDNLYIKIIQILNNNEM